jgi:phage terminase Nu1 subunit (DNA packaging protein)
MPATTAAAAPEKPHPDRGSVSAAAPEGEIESPAGDPKKPVGAAALGLLLGISDRAVRDMAKAGHVVAVGKNRYDVAASVPKYCDHLRKLAMGKYGDTADVGAGTRARARLAEAQASLAEAKNARLRGSLLEADAVQREWSAVLSAVRARMLSVPSRAAQRLPHMTAHDVGEIDREIRNALTELGED